MGALSETPPPYTRTAGRLHKMCTRDRSYRLRRYWAQSNITEARGVYHCVPKGHVVRWIDVSRALADSLAERAPYFGAQARPRPGELSRRHPCR